MISLSLAIIVNFLLIKYFVFLTGDNVFYCNSNIEYNHKKSKKLVESRQIFGHSVALNYV